MSGIKISFEAENLGVGSRPNSRKRRSSILKSPSRNALHDLDPNAEEVDATSQAKKQRRSSRRVSFANTYQVQEFLTANQLKILEDTKPESEVTQPVSPIEKDADPSTHTEYRPSSVVTFIQDGGETVPHQPEDISVGPGHCIRGLETLLSGPIKSHSTPHSEAKSRDLFNPRVYPQLTESAAQLPKIEETCEMQVKVESGNTERFDPENHTAQDWPELTSTCNNLAIGLVGPSYHCTLPVSDSFNSSRHTSLSSASTSSGNSSFPVSLGHNDVPDSEINLNDTAVFELTLHREQFLAGLSDTNDQVFEAPLEIKIKSENFYMQSGDYLTADSAKFGQRNSSEKKTYAKSVLKSIFGNDSPAEETHLSNLDDMEVDLALTTCRSRKVTDGVCNKSCSSAFLKSLTQPNYNDPADKPGSMASSAKRNTASESHNRATANMDLTSCIGSSFSKEETSTGPLKHQDVTVRFGDDSGGGMELTRCIGGLDEQLRQQKTSVSKHQGSRPLEDITPIFRGQSGGEMDLTTNHIPSSVAIHHTQEEQTQIFIQDDTASSMEMTTCLDSGSFFLKSSEKVDIRDIPDLGQDKTQIFHVGDTDSHVEITTCFDEQTSLKSERKSSANFEIGPEKIRISRSSEKTTSVDITVRQGNLARSCEATSDADVSTNIPLKMEATGISYDNTIAGMEMTLDMRENENPLISREIRCVPGICKNGAADGVEKTRIFLTEDATGAMELTTCLSENMGSKRLTEASSELKMNQPKESVEVTRVFQFDDAGMDMTECLGKVKSPETASLQRPITQELKTSASDKTQIFDAGESRGMDLTTCVGSIFTEQEHPHLKTSATEGNKIGVSKGSSRELKAQDFLSKCQEMPHCTLQTVLPEDRTTHFTSDETAKMELTGGVGNLILKAPDTRQLPQKQIDDTHIFTLDEAACMELTACVTSLKPLPSVVSPGVHTSQITVILDETSKMEMTSCVGGILPKKSVDADQGKRAKQHGEHTKVFSNLEEADMDFTKCIDGLQPKTSSSGQTYSAEMGEHTKVFSSEDTAKMEITTCIGEPLMRNLEALTVTDSSKSVITEHTPANLKSHWSEVDQVTSSISQQPLSQDRTCIFTSSNTAAMELTCIGLNNERCTESSKDNSLYGVAGESTSSQAADFILSDKTRVFDHDVSRKMELTLCIGREEMAKHVCDPDPSRPLPDSTRHFIQEEVSGMELTECVEVNSDKAMNLFSDHPLTCHKFRRVSAESCDGAEWMASKIHSEMVVPSVQAEENFKLKGMAVLQEENSHAQKDQRSSHIGEDTGTTEPMDTISSQSQSAQEANQLSLPASSDITVIEDTSLTQRRSETFTIEGASAKKPTEGELGEAATRRSDTYTLEKPSVSSEAEGDPTSDTNCQSAGSVDKDSVPACWGNLDATDGIDSELPVWVENTEDFSQLSAEAGVASLMMMEAMREQNHSRNAHELPTFVGDNVGETAASEALPDIDEECQKAGEMVPSSNMNPQKDIGLPMGPVSFQEFLQMVTLKMPKGRRSVLPSIPQEVSQQTMSDVLADHFIWQPKKELYEWGINHLSSLTEKMQDAVDEQEQRLNEDSPEIFKEIQRASPEKAAELQDRVLSLHKACSKMSRLGFKEWKLKMITKTHKAFKNAETEMTEILGSLKSSLGVLQKSLEDLGKFQKELDTISLRQKKVQLPSDEQIREFLENEKLLAVRLQEIQEIKEEKASLESESLRLKREIKEFEKELADTVEKEWSLSNRTPLDDVLQDAMVKLGDLHRLQKWRLQKHSQEEMVFTFFEDTLNFTVSLGKDGESGEDVLQKKITDLSLKCLLADDASVGSHLAHNLFQAAVDVNTLHSNYPSTASLKLLLQELSDLAVAADGLAAETDKISSRHIVTLNGTDLTVIFNNLDAMVRFFLTFKLRCGSYPFSPISTDFKLKVGQIREKDVQLALSQVKPGWTYLTRLVQSVDSLIQQHAAE